VHWMRVGFVHGVMNTDNMSILGLTIDYGPYGWIDHFDPNWTPNTTDAQGRRYCYGRQMEIARWNLGCLASALASLDDDHEWLQAGMAAFDETLNESWTSTLAKKFGVGAWQDGDGDWINAAFDLMKNAEIDFAEFFRLLATVDARAPTAMHFADAFYTADSLQTHREILDAWLKTYLARRSTFSAATAHITAEMNAVNPRFVLRNYLAQLAIDKAHAGDDSGVHELLRALETPYDVRAEHAHLYAKRPDWARQKAGCSMLSCSS
jgi:serine/tyrosine/threonine adenylyltransferase